MRDVEAMVSEEPNTGCWLWTGAVDRFGYGNLRRHGKGWLAHRWMWTVHRGPIPVGLKVLHRCDNGRIGCCNPDHLFIGTQRENMRDMARKNRQPNRRLTPVDVRKIRSMVADGAMTRDVGSLFGVSATTVSNIHRRRRWAEVADA